MTEFKKLIPSLALIVLAIGGLVSAYINTSQSEEIQELRSRIDIMEAYFPVGAQPLLSRRREAIHLKLRSNATVYIKTTVILRFHLINLR